MSEPTRAGLYRIWALLAEFETPEQLVAAAQKANEQGYRKMEAYSPLPIQELPAAMGLGRTRLPWAVLLGGIIGGLTGYFTQYIALVWWYPINVGGRPYHSWPSFVPVTFEMTVLLSALTGVATLMIASRLPRPHHPVFNATSFTRSTRDHFFLAIETLDPKFEMERTRNFLQSLNPLSIEEVVDDSLPGGVR